MHVYFITRGGRKWTRRLIEFFEDIYLNFKNILTGEKYGSIQLMPREIKAWEMVFPAEHKKRVLDLLKNHGCEHVHVTKIITKKDKFHEGMEML